MTSLAKTALTRTFPSVVLSTQQNMHISKLLMQDLNEALEQSNMLWGKHMGSSVLWEQHRQRLQQWNSVMQDLEMHQVSQSFF